MRLISLLLAALTTAQCAQGFVIQPARIAGRMPTSVARRAAVGLGPTMCVPKEVAAAIHYLASDDAAMVNGHALHIDGGMAAGPSIQSIEAAIGERIHGDDGISP